MRHYWEIYKEFFRTSFAQATSFRVNFVLLFLMDNISYLIAIGGVSFIFQHVSTLGSWNKDQLLFFISFMLVMDNLHMTLISENFWIFGDDLKQGKLDFVFLKPIHPIFIIFFASVRAGSFFSFPLAWGLLIYHGLALDLSFFQWSLVPVFIILGLTLQIVIEIIISTSMFWLIDGMGVNFLRMQFQQLARWPDFVFKKMFRRIFTFFIPILLIGSAPVNMLFGNDLLFYIPMYGLALSILFFVMLRLWKFAEKHYESASS